MLISENRVTLVKNLFGFLQSEYPKSIRDYQFTDIPGCEGNKPGNLEMKKMLGN